MHITRSVKTMKTCRGFSLIEVMVSVFILSVGLLGVASMQASSIKVNVGAYNQSQANILMTEILDRMRLNRDAFLAGRYDNVNTDESQASEQQCISSNGGCNSSQLALNDIRDFTGFFKDVNDLGANFVALIPGGSAIINRDVTTNLATVSVTWDQEVWSSVGGEMEKNLTTQFLTMTVKI